MTSRRSSGSVPPPFPRALSILLPVYFLLPLLLLPPSTAFEQSKCGFESPPDYAVKWAFEPQTRNVVFAMKAKLPSAGGQPGEEPKQAEFTGIGFGTEDEMSFIGVSMVNDQLDIVRGQMDAPGQFRVDPLGAVKGEAQSAVKGLSLKRLSDGTVLAQFARPLKASRGVVGPDLAGCPTFFLPTRWIAFAPGAPAKFPSNSTQRLRVCGIAEECRLEESSSPPPRQPIRRSTPAIESGGPESSAPLPELAHSVDVSGRGDPCSFGGPHYAVQWTYNGANRSVDFLLRQKTRPGRWWSAVGIGDNMSDMDIGAVFLENGRPQSGMLDFFSSGYEPPEKDRSQDWTLDRAASKVEGDEVQLHFSRKLDTGDQQKDRSLDGCVLFQFAVNSGTYGDGFRMHKHESWPDLYKACDLKSRCERRAGGAGKWQQPIELGQSLDGPSSSGERGRNETEEETVEGREKKSGGGRRGPEEMEGDLVISMLMKNLGPRIVQAVAESEEREEREPAGNLTAEFVPEDGGQLNRAAKERASNGSSGEEGPKPMASKRQGPDGQGQSADGGTETPQTAPMTSAGDIAQGPAESSSPAAAGAGETANKSPFSLNAFLGGEEGQQSPPTTGAPTGGTAGEPTAGQSQRTGGLTAPSGAEEEEGTTASQPARFDISQMLAGPGPEESNPQTTAASATATSSISTAVQPTASSGGWSTGDGTTISSADGQGLPVSIADQQFASSSVAATTAPQQLGEGGLGETTVTATDEQQKGSSSAGGGGWQSTPAGVGGTEGARQEGRQPPPPLGSSPVQRPAEPSTLAPLPPNDQQMPPAERQPSTEIVPAAGITVDIEATNGTTGGEMGAQRGPGQVNSTESEPTATSELPEEEVYSTFAPGTNGTREEGESVEGNSVEANGGAEGGQKTAPGFATTPGEGANNGLAPAGEKESKGTSKGEETGNPVQQQHGDIKLPVATGKCEGLRPDLGICRSYMENYLGRVKDWSDRHGQPLEGQYPKACKLLSAVPHVPTLCCQVFSDKCAPYI